MYRKIRISLQTLLYVFLALVPILPSYFTALRGISVYYVISAGFAALSLFFLKGRVRLLRPKSRVLTMFLVLWILAHSVSMILTEGAFHLVMFLLITVVVFVFVSASVNTQESFIGSLHCLIYTSGVVAVFGLIEALTRFNVFSLLNNSGATLNYSTERFGRVRLLSYSWQAIVYGVYLMFCMILLLYCLQFLKKKNAKFVVFISIYVLLWVNLLLTLSRSSIIAAVFANLLFLYFSGFVRMLKTILITVVCVAALVVLVALVFPKAFDLMMKFYFMMVSLIDDSYASEIAASFGTNLKAEGNRIDLYNWVFKSMKGKWLFGFGQHAQFEYPYKVTDGMYTWTVVKKGIENNYLDTIFRYGLVGAIPEFCMYVSVLVYSFAHRAKASWEKSVSFNSAVFSVMLAYFLEMFAVNQSSDRMIFYPLIMLFLCYNIRNKFQTDYTEKRLNDA